jgi:hypothetical protein
VFIRQDLQDYSGLFFILSHFPDGSEKTQSACGGKNSFLNFALQVISQLSTTLVSPKYFLGLGHFID